MKEVNFLDRVPTYPGRVIMTPVPGQANTYDMIRADDPTVVGTPLDKATFNSIAHSRLTGRYYTPTISRTVKTNSAGLKTNPIPTSGWVGSTTTKYTSGGYTVSANTSADNEVTWNAFDGNDVTAWRTSGAALSGSQWIMVQLPSAVTVKKVKLRYEHNNYLLTTTVQGSNDGTSWTDLLTISGAVTTKTEYTLSKTGAFSYYRLAFSINGSALVYCYAFEISEYDVSTYENAFTIADGVSSVWDEGQRVMVQIPSAANTFGVVSNTLNGVAVNTILQPNKRYELRYAGSAFVAKEV